MTGRVQITPQALEDMDNIATYIGGDSLDAALHFLEETEATLDLLATMPHLGTARKYKEAHLAGVRMWPVRNFDKCLIFYRPIRGGMEVIRVLHSARDIDSILLEG